MATRTLLGFVMTAGTDRRLVACAGYTSQLAGSIAFILAAGTNVPLLIAGVILFGAGFGNATSLPPLIAQVEFVEEDVPRADAQLAAAQACACGIPRTGSRGNGRCRAAGVAGDSE